MTIAINGTITGLHANQDGGGTLEIVVASIADFEGVLGHVVSGTLETTAPEPLPELVIESTPTPEPAPEATPTGDDPMAPEAAPEAVPTDPGTEPEQTPAADPMSPETPTTPPA